MKKQQLFIFFSAVVILIGVIIYISLSRNNQSVKTVQISNLTNVPNTPIIISPSVVISEPAPLTTINNWKYYSDQNFSFKYPPRWTLQVTPPNDYSGRDISLNSPDGSSLNLYYDQRPPDGLGIHSFTVSNPVTLDNTPLIKTYQNTCSLATDYSIPNPCEQQVQGIDYNLPTVVDLQNHIAKISYLHSHVLLINMQLSKAFNIVDPQFQTLNTTINTVVNTLHLPK